MMREKVRPEFWRTLSLEELTQLEWETLCDGCGKCCLIKLENEETEVIHYTKIACRLFDDGTCKCGNYPNRKKLVSNCLVLTKDTLKHSYHWMPTTCAYRLIYEGKDLKPWHHLISGSSETVHEAGMSVKYSTIPEYDIPEDSWDEYVISNY
tara:strand:+ start:512 stop:967 length:456 start_codon:yes stop_codon:yes gene_type:complete